MRYYIFRINIITVVVLFLLISINSCKKEASLPSNQYKYQIPEHKNDGWNVSSLSEVGMDISAIDQIIPNINPAAVDRTTTSTT